MHGNIADLENFTRGWKDRFRQLVKGVSAGGQVDHFVRLMKAKSEGLTV
jgi:hypothetical protein